MSGYRRGAEHRASPLDMRPSWQEALRLEREERLTLSAIAARMNVSKNTASQYLQNAREVARLRADLARAEGGRG